ncbi:MULE transposase domain [Sesbania bispinosa]|nr:MULE transposase domain [Sesbania bispinosa]
MSYKHPAAIVTDGGSSMREAIKQVFSNVSHRLCAWHLHKNTCENVKNSGFLDDFKVAMYSNFTEEKFEVYWKRMVAKHGLVGNKWVTKTYENRSMWASAYFRDKFFGCIRTTSQCEAINSLVKAYVNKKDTILEFINRFEQVLREYTKNEMIAKFKSMFTQPILTTSLQKIEIEAAKIFTLEIFREVKYEIEVACALNVIAREENGEKLIFKMNPYGKPGHDVQVVYDVVNSQFLCDCRLFESRGIPCSYVICAMKNENMQSIPRSLILNRWTKKCKSDLISSYQSEDVDTYVMKTARLGAAGGVFQRSFPELVGKEQEEHNMHNSASEDNEENGSTPVDEDNGGDMELSNRTQRFKDNEVNVKLSCSDKGKEKEKDADKAKGKQNHGVNCKGKGKGKEQNRSIGTTIGANNEIYRANSIPNYSFGHGSSSQPIGMPPQYGYVPSIPLVMFLFTLTWLCKTHRWWFKGLLVTTMRESPRRRWEAVEGDDNMGCDLLHFLAMAVNAHGGTSWNDLLQQVMNNGIGIGGKPTKHMKSMNGEQ